jgi:hypothetical protein
LGQQIIFFGVHSAVALKPRILTDQPKTLTDVRQPNCFSKKKASVNYWQKCFAIGPGMLVT